MTSAAWPSSAVRQYGSTADEMVGASAMNSSLRTGGPDRSVDVEGSTWRHMKGGKRFINDSGGPHQSSC